MKASNSTMSKRPPVDLKALTAAQAAPMPEAVQRMAPPSPVGSVKTANLEAPAFKVPPELPQAVPATRRGRRPQTERVALCRSGRLGREARPGAINNSHLLEFDVYRILSVWKAAEWRR
ncbi:MAG: hypothetical protein MZV65_46850 [Chromatiales bacterium]|nr:hypothetical protein [Chromatiales bacterium]